MLPWRMLQGSNLLTKDHRLIQIIIKLIYHYLEQDNSLKAKLEVYHEEAFGERV